MRNSGRTGWLVKAVALHVTGFTAPPFSHVTSHLFGDSRRKGQVTGGQFVTCGRARVMSTNEYYFHVSNGDSKECDECE